MAEAAVTTDASQKAAVDFDDIQALLRFGHKNLTEACFVLLRVRDRAAAQAWLAAAPVSAAIAQSPPPRTALQIALTAEGLRALGVAENVIEGFAPEFVAGMAADAARSRRLGDVGGSDPGDWAWGGRGSNRVSEPHVLLMLYAAPGGLAAWQGSIIEGCAAGFEELLRLPASDLSGTEPFGFVDGVSQPVPDWERRREVRDTDRLDYGNLACLGEFVLGYPNEYAGYTERPLLEPQRDAAAATLPRAEDAPDMADLGRNGSYLVIRQLAQDVRGFWRFLDAQANGDAARRRRLAELMVGRTMDGQPLMGETESQIDGVDRDDMALNGFTYRDDPDGLRCPIGAHVRRSNPRNADLPPGAATSLVARGIRMLGFDAEGLQQDRVASTRFHRLLRRGREYGARVSLADVLSNATSDETPDEENGIYFICLGASIARQFEFVQGAWLAGSRFGGLVSESDPLLGQRQPGPDGRPTDTFSIPDDTGVCARVSGLPPFVTVRGGGYFFLPGLRALRYLATSGAPT